MQLPLNVSSVSASFFGFQRQGIHLVLCVACSLHICFFGDPLLHKLLLIWRSAKLKIHPIQLFKYGCQCSSQDDPQQLKSGNQQAFCVSHVSLTDLGSSSEEPLLPRKEVIQPHLPVRLPCYDFTPIMDHTVSVYLPFGLTRRFIVQPTFVM